jgi:hypothetical protein
VKELERRFPAIGYALANVQQTCWEELISKAKSKRSDPDDGQDRKMLSYQNLPIRMHNIPSEADNSGEVVDLKP